MADPLTIFGSTASVISIIDVLAKTIVTIQHLREEWKEANLTFLSLSSQLTALKGALTNIKEWMESDADGAHHLLVMDLSNILKCCEVLAAELNEKLSGLQCTSYGILERTAKLRLVMNSNTMDRVSKMIETQTGALTLLFSISTRNALSDHQKLLDKSSTRKALTRVQKETASLIVHRDTSSLPSEYGENLSKQSLIFDFDPELFASKVYSPIIRKSLNPSFRFRHPQPSRRPSLSTFLDESEMVGMQNLATPQRTKILILGTSNSSKSTILKQIQHIYGGGFSKSERRDARTLIYSNLRDAVERIFQALRSQDLVLDEDSPANRLRSLPPEVGFGEPLPLRFLDPFMAFIANRLVVSVMARAENDLGCGNITYLFQNINRLFHPTYLPTDEDMLHASIRTTGIDERTFDICDISHETYDLGGRRPERRKWIHVFKDPSIVLFMVLVGRYGHCLAEDEGVKQLHEDMEVFESTINSQDASQSEKFLLFTQMDILEKKIAERGNPFCTYFPDYTGDRMDFQRVQGFLENKFKSIYRGKGEIHTFWLDATNTDHVRNVMQWVHTLRNDLSWRKDTAPRSDVASVLPQEPRSPSLVFGS